MGYPMVVMTKQEFLELEKKMVLKRPGGLAQAYGDFVRHNYQGFSFCSLDSDPILFQVRKPVEEEELLQVRLDATSGQETFSDMLVRLLREKKKNAPEVYKSAGIDARLYSKIIGNRNYRTSKETVLAFAIALHLSLQETDELLGKAGFALQSSSLFDVSIEFFLERQLYDRNVIDAMMSDFNLPLLPQNWTL